MVQCKATARPTHLCGALALGARAAVRPAAGVVAGHGPGGVHGATVPRNRTCDGGGAWKGGARARLLCKTQGGRAGTPPIQGPGYHHPPMGPEGPKKIGVRTHPPTSTQGREEGRVQREALRHTTGFRRRFTFHTFFSPSLLKPSQSLPFPSRGSLVISLAENLLLSAYQRRSHYRTLL